MGKSAKRILFYAVLLALWWALAKARIWPPYVFPDPGSVLEALKNGTTDGTVWVAIRVSLRRIALGYGISLLLGMALGLLIASNKFLEETLGGMVVSLQSLPSICWLPLAVLWFGLTETAILFVVIMGSLLSITISMEAGRRSVPTIYRMSARNLGAQGWRMFFYVLLPASLPHLVSGMKQGWAFAWRSLISGEMIFVSLGLGHLLMLGRDLNDMSLVIAIMLLIVAIGCVVDGLLFRSLERHIQQKWGTAAAL